MAGQQQQATLLSDTLCQVARQLDSCAWVADNTAHNTMPHNWPLNYSGDCGTCNAHWMLCISSSFSYQLRLFFPSNHLFCYPLAFFFCYISILRSITYPHGCYIRCSDANVSCKIYALRTNEQLCIYAILR